MTLDEQQAICGAVQHEVYCANHCDWRGLEADLVEDEEGNEPHCPKCGSNWAILDVDLEAFAYTARTEWPKLIEEHRKALAEIERLKTALSDLLHQQSNHSPTCHRVTPNANRWLSGSTHHPYAKRKHPPSGCSRYTPCLSARNPAGRATTAAAPERPSFR